MALQRWSKQVTGVYTVQIFNQQAVYTFPAIPQGFAASISVAVPGSGSAVDWQVYVTGQLVGSTQGPQPCGPIYLGQGDVLSLVGNPITNVGTAVASGAIGLPSEVPPASVITNYNQGVIGANLIAVGTGTLTPSIPLNSTVRGILVLTNPSIYPDLASGDAGLFLPVNQYAMAAQYGATGLVDGVWFLPTAGLPSIQVSFSASTSWQIYYVEYDFDFYEVARGLGVYTIPIANPATATDWSYILPAPGRLAAFSGVFVTSAAAGNRIIRLVFASAGGAALSQSLLTLGGAATASNTYDFNTWPGAAQAQGGVAPNLYASASIPDVLLPAGATIEAATLNMTAGDQWEYVVITLSPI